MNIKDVKAALLGARHLRIVLFLLLLLVTTVSAGFLTSSDKTGDDLSMIVISDVHVMAPSLLKQDGKAFAAYVANDRKMLKESPLLMEEVTEEIIRRHPQYLLVTGDLTKDGETVSHRYLCDNYLSRIRQAGIRVFVIPGNHDVDNPHAVEFLGDETRRVPTPKADEFAQIYHDYGYGEAISRDEHSLSYVVQLAENTRMICIDACEYEENDYEKDICVTAGRLKDETIEYIRSQAEEAESKGMRLIAMMHHGIVQHWTWQEKAMGEYLVEDWSKRAPLFAKLGIEVVFTGHFHAQDIAKKGSLYDIETGSTISYPSPYRIVTFTGNKLTVHTEHLTGRGIALPAGETLGDYSRRFAASGISTLLSGILPEETPATLRDSICSLLGEAYTAHLGGDEAMPEEKGAEIKATGSRLKKYSSWKLAYIFNHITKYLWTDLGPQDNDIEIELDN